jgi:hypothetical protein
MAKSNLLCTSSLPQVSVLFLHGPPVGAKQGAGAGHAGGATTKESYAEAGDVELKSIVVSFYCKNPPLLYSGRKSPGCRVTRINVGTSHRWRLWDRSRDPGRRPCAGCSGLNPAASSRDAGRGLCCGGRDGGICPGLELRALRRSRLPSRTCPSSMADVNESPEPRTANVFMTWSEMGPPCCSGPGVKAQITLEMRCECVNVVSPDETF